MKNLLVTGALGFVGSNFVKYVSKNYGSKYNIVILDKVTYAADISNLSNVKVGNLYICDICDMDKVEKIIRTEKIDEIVHFAAESHVDSSIKNPFIFMQTNAMGTQSMLEAARRVWGENSDNRFVYISTDEVYGSLGDFGYFTENSKLAPNSPYSSSKASADLIARSYFSTYNMNICITRSSNNYGPNQHVEKLIPHMIDLALKDKKLPVYGNGLNVRDWIYVKDNCKAIFKVLRYGKKGEVYNIGSNNERTNLEIVKFILKTLGKDESLITFVEDRKAHDYRYALDSSKIKLELLWKPEVSFEEGMIYTINHYVEKFKK